MRGFVVSTASSIAAFGILLLSSFDFISPDAVAQPSATSGAPSPAASISTADFVKTAAISDMYEVEAAQVAESRSTNGAVKNFAAKMVEAHTATTTQLKDILASTNQTSLAPSGLDAKHQGELDQLKRVAAAQFDTTYAQQQVQAHEDAVTLFTGYSQSGQDPQIKKFAADTLPTIQQHLDMARQLSASH